MKSHLSFVSILALVCICVSCGGGGGGGDENGGFVDTSQALALNDSNALPVSGLVVDAAAGGITVGSLGTVVIASADSQSGSGFEFKLLRVTQDVLDLIWEMRLQGTLDTANFSPAQVPPSVDCDDGGTVTAIWTDNDQDLELSVGDGVALSFNNCAEDGLLFNGELVVGVMSMVGDPLTDPEWTVLLRLNFNSLTASDDGYILEVVGTLDVTVDTRASGEVVTEITTEIDTGSGTTASSFLYFGDGEDFIELTLFSVIFQENPNGSFAVSGQGTLESSFIGGTVNFETTLDITGTDFDDNNPSAGEMLILGASGSSVLLRILDSVFVELDVDDEGDGFDADDPTITSTWDELSDAVDAL
ncbi:MAG: hypothetical protein ACYSR9_07415 [Planctomycetota bacterium]|jgi:hypothetical protein